MITNPFDQLDERLARIERALLAQNSPKAPEDPFPPVLSLSQASELTGYSTEYLYQLRSRGEVPCLSLKGQKLRFSRDTLRRWLEMGAPKDAKAVMELTKSQLR